jgi:peptidylamidoglycolate lyase
MILLLIAGYIFHDKKIGKGNDSYTRFELVKGWPQLPDGFTLGNPTGIGIDTNQNIFIFHRANREWPLLGSMPKSKISSGTIVLLDSHSGKILNSWGDSIFIMPHGLTVDKNNNVWVTDVGLNQIFKFSHDGNLLMTLGTAEVAGYDSAHFNRPTDVAVASDGSFYVSDGYGNSRIIKFSPEGKYLFEWGKKGKGEGEFNIPHGLDLDKKGNVYVADRENSRIQVFDSSGRFLKQFSSKNFGNICSVTFDKRNEKLVAVDDVTFLKIKHRGSDILILDSAGNIQTRFGRSGFYDGSLCWYHDVAIDNKENIYTSDIHGNRIQKFKKISTR